MCIFSIACFVLREFIVNGQSDLLSDSPIMVNISYQDVQGKSLSTELFLYVDVNFLTLAADGSGYATYTIMAK